jgi:hypothetical protein
MTSPPTMPGFVLMPKPTHPERNHTIKRLSYLIMFVFTFSLRFRGDSDRASSFVDEPFSAVTAIVIAERVYLSLKHALGYII